MLCAPRSAPPPDVKSACTAATRAGRIRNGEQPPSADALRNLEARTGALASLGVYHAQRRFGVDGLVGLSAPNTAKEPGWQKRIKSTTSPG